MSRDHWKIEDDLCRCCHSEGTFKNLAGAYNFGEDEEMYFNMLQDTLDINIMPVSGSLCVPTYTICDACIVRLRDASTFKKQVIHCEQKFQRMYGTNSITLAETDFSIEIKEESPEENTKPAVESPLLGDDDDDELFDKDDNGDDGIDCDEEFSTELIKQDSKKKPKKAPPKAKPKPKAKKPPKKCGRPRKIKEITKEEAPGDQEKTTDGNLRPVTSKLEQLLTEGSKQQRRLQLLSNIEDGPNKKDISHSCNEAFPGIELAQNQVKTIHTELHNSNFLKAYRFTKEEDNNIRLNNIESYSCTTCSKDFQNKWSFQYHLKSYHKFKKCPDCDLLIEGQKLKIHRHEAHGVPIPTCGICGYKTWFRAKLTKHQRRVHMNEKNVSCDQCDLKFFDRMSLRMHKIVHSSERNFECSFCHKRYPRRNTLRMHEKIHNKVQDKVCSLCGKGFVQKASLNYHMKKYHPEAC